MISERPVFGGVSAQDGNTQANFHSRVMVYSLSGDRRTVALESIAAPAKPANAPSGPRWAAPQAASIPPPPPSTHRVPRAGRLSDIILADSFRLGNAGARSATDSRITRLREARTAARQMPTPAPVINSVRFRFISAPFRSDSSDRSLVGEYPKRNRFALMRLGASCLAADLPERRFNLRTRSRRGRNQGKAGIAPVVAL